jgi:hypothetical protein
VEKLSETSRSTSESETFFCSNENHEHHLHNRTRESTTTTSSTKYEKRNSTSVAGFQNLKFGVSADEDSQFIGSLSEGSRDVFWRTTSENDVDDFKGDYEFWF